MRKVLVTGAYGFIGKHMVAALKGAGYQVGIMDKGRDDEGDYDGIIHLAAVSRVSAGDSDRVQCLETNIVLTAKILERQCRWFILASTNEAPLNVYGMSKRFAEDYARHIAKERGLGLRLLRFATVYGEGDNPEKLIPTVARKAKAGEEIKLRDGVLPVGYIHVKELVYEIMEHVMFLTHTPSFIPHALPVQYGIAKTKEELVAVACG